MFKEVVRAKMLEQEEKQTIFTKLKRFYVESKRVLKVTRKPDKQEFQTIVKVSGLGMLIIGLVGFIIQIVKQMLF